VSFFLLNILISLTSVLYFNHVCISMKRFVVGGFVAFFLQQAMSVAWVYKYTLQVPREDATYYVACCEARVAWCGQRFLTAVGLALMSGYLLSVKGKRMTDRYFLASCGHTGRNSSEYSLLFIFFAFVWRLLIY